MKPSSSTHILTCLGLTPDHTMYSEPKDLIHVLKQHNFMDLVYGLREKKKEENEEEEKKKEKKKKFIRINL